MSLRNGVRAIGLSVWAWMLCLGTLAAQNTLPAEEPPAALFLEAGGADALQESFGKCDQQCSTCDAQCKAQCEKCSTSARCAAATSNCAGWTPMGIGAVIQQLGLDDHSRINDLELVWYGTPAVSLTVDCDDCPGLLGAWSPWCENCGDAAHLTVFCKEPACAEQTTLEPGEPAEVLLEIRNRVGMTPLTGTAYQPMDSTTCAKARNTFVAEVRESAESEAASERDPELEALFYASEHPAAEADGPTPMPGRKPGAELVPLLRKVSRNLDEAANALEDAELYFRADQLREIANELRLEARTAGGAWSLEPLGLVPRKTAPEPQPDLRQENEELRAELERLRESLRASHDDSEVKTR